MHAAREEIEIRLAPDLSAPERARRSLESVGEKLRPEVFDDIQLLVNELVTNSVKFAPEGAIALKLTASEAAVRVEVHDDGPGFVPTDAEPELGDTSGRGLFLVDALADRWGVTLDGTTCVWFEIDEAAGAA